MVLNSLLCLNVNLWKLSFNSSSLDWHQKSLLFLLVLKINTWGEFMWFHLARDIPPGLYGERPAAVRTGRRAICREALESWSWKTLSLGSDAEWQTPGSASSTAVYLTCTHCTPTVNEAKTKTDMMRNVYDREFSKANLTKQTFSTSSRDKNVSKCMKAALTTNLSECCSTCLYVGMEMGTACLSL